MSEVVRIGSVIIFHLSKLWKAKFFILCDVIFLVRLQERLQEFTLITLGSERVNISLKAKCPYSLAWTPQAQAPLRDAHPHHSRLARVRLLFLQALPPLVIFIAFVIAFPFVARSWTRFRLAMSQMVMPTVRMSVLVVGGTKNGRWSSDF